MKLKLESCAQLSDISAFGRVPELYLSDCPKISDISSLNYNKRVIIENCVLINNCRKSFQFTQYLKIRSHQPVEILFDFSHYHSLRAFDCYSVIPVEGSILSPVTPYSVQRLPERLLVTFHLRQLALTNQSIDPKDVPLLGSIRCLCLEHINNLTSIEGLGRGNISVVIKSCSRILDFSPLKSVPSVTIEACDGLIDGSQLNEVKELTIISCPYLMDFSSLGQGHVHHLTLISRLLFGFEVKSFAGLGRIPILNVHNMSIAHRIPSLDGLGEANEKIIFPSFITIPGLDQLSLKYHVIVNKEEVKKIFILRK